MAARTCSRRCASRVQPSRPSQSKWDTEITRHPNFAGPRAPPKLDRFSGAVAYEPSPAYAWLQYLVATNVTAPAAMLKVGVAGRSGLGYGKDDRYIRLELLMRDVTFDAMMRKLERLA